ncbi:MAG: hypothetical protein ACK4MQ_08375 [Hyphomonas sp.]
MLRFDGLVITTVSVTPDFLPEQLCCVCLDICPSIIGNYETADLPDPFSPLVHRYPGRAIYNLALMGESQWIRSPLYTDHCKLYGIYRILRIGYRYPGKDRLFLSIDYTASELNQSWGRFGPSEMELASFPFALAWLLRHGALDAPRLEAYFDRIFDLSAAQVTYLRKYVNSPEQDLAGQAADLGYSVGGYKQSLYALRDAVYDRLNLPSERFRQDTSKSLRLLDHNYRFLTLMGDPARPQKITLKGAATG